MNDELNKGIPDLDDLGVVELDDEVLDSIAGGYVYHDPGDAAAHRKESFYVVDDAGQIVMRLNDLAAAKHWAGNLRTSQKVITAEQFDRLRRTGSI